jgi:hypothetical protein
MTSERRTAGPLDAFVTITAKPTSSPPSRHPCSASPHQRDAFIAAYGHDIRSWPGYPILRDIRELSTLSALLRDGHINPPARREIQIRLRSLRTSDNQQWTPF